VSAAANRGTEYLAVSDDGSGKRNVTIAVAIPSNFDADHPCIVAIPSSGSRGVYGEMATIGEWTLNKGCAAALTDKGTGVGTHDLDRDLAYAIDGTMTAAGSRKDLTFNANLLGDDLASYRATHPNRMALKHAHGKQNAEKDWGNFTLQAIRTAFYVLNKQFPTRSFTPSTTLVIASSISNGGGSVLRAAEQDSDGLIDGVVAAEPQVNLPANANVQVRRGGTLVAGAGKPLMDYFTYAGLYQACATRSSALAGTSAFVVAGFAANRCAALAAMGLVSGATVTEQGDDALTRLHAYGWEPDSDILHDSHYGFEFTDLVSHTYANAYARASVAEGLCGYSVAGMDANSSIGVPPAAAMRTAWALGSGLGFLTAGYNLVNDNSVGGPALYLLSVSQSTGKMDYDVDGAACLRRLATRGAVGNTALTTAEDAIAARVQAGVDEVRVTGDLRGKPVVVLQGRSDALLPVNHTSRPYTALNARADGATQLRYYEVTDANHFDALVGLYPRTLVPLHVYTLRALDLMYAKLGSGGDLPPSQVVRAVARSSGAATLTDANVPPIATSPATSNRITVGPAVIDVPQ
jgi:hydroxybutyrate-dimer hydrolase